MALAGQCLCYIFLRRPVKSDCSAHFPPAQLSTHLGPSLIPRPAQTISPEKRLEFNSLLFAAGSQQSIASWVCSKQSLLLPPHFSMDWTSPTCTQQPPFQWLSSVLTHSFPHSSLFCSSSATLFYYPQTAPLSLFLSLSLSLFPPFPLSLSLSLQMALKQPWECIAAPIMSPWFLVSCTLSRKVTRPDNIIYIAV